jgi:hypothetical protein
MTTTHRITTAAAVILSLAAAGAPAASAQPLGADPVSSPASNGPVAVYSRPDKSMVYSRHDKPMLPTSATAGGDFLAPAAPPAVVRVQAPQNGFDWGDAAIGAAGGIGIALLATGGGLGAVRRRRDHLDPATR